MPTDDLVARLSRGEHPIEVSLRPQKTVAALKEAVDRGFVNIRFTTTRGGTELAVQLDPETKTEFDNDSAAMTIAGALTLNGQRVRCIAKVELPSLRGTGHLESMETTPCQK